MCAPIKSLGLERRFELVLLLSHLVIGLGGFEMLRSAARHVTDDGAVLVQRLEPGRVCEPGAVRLGEVMLSLDSIKVSGNLVQATSEYALRGRAWRQPWQLPVVEDAELSVMVDRVGLALADVDGAWALLRPAGA